MEMQRELSPKESFRDFCSTLSKSSEIIEIRRGHAWLQSNHDALKMPTTTFSAREIVAIYLVASEANACPEDVEQYCDQAHQVGFSKLEIAEILHGWSPDPKLGALINMTLGLIEHRGAVSLEETHDFFDAGWSHSALVELIGLVCICSINNYLTNSKAA